MKKSALGISIIVIYSIVLTACGGAEIEPNTLMAIKVADAALDANAAFWDDAPVLEIPTVGSTDDADNGPKVMVQAAYDDQYIVMRVEWEDATESAMKSAWTWDGESFEKSGGEDRLMLAWPITTNPEFASKGCGLACHNEDDDQDNWWMGADDEDTRYDAWHWKASRTNPLGYADDKWWGAQTEPEAYGKGSRHGDAKDSGGYADNHNEEGTGPLYMHGTDLSSPLLFAGDAVDIDTSQLSPGDVVPGYVLEYPVGSRGDIQVIGVWEDGKWTLVVRRLLNTGNDDDIVFVPPRSVPFGLSVVDDGGGLDHTVGEEVLVLEWE